MDLRQDTFPVKERVLFFYNKKSMIYNNFRKPKRFNHIMKTQLFQYSRFGFYAGIRERILNSDRESDG